MTSHTNNNTMGDHSVHAHTAMYAPKLCPAIYCDSLVMAVCVPSTDPTCSSTTSNNIPSPSPDRPYPSPAVPSSSSFSSPSSLASYLSSLGFELVGVTPSLVDDCAHSRPHTHTLTHVIYNKQYTDEEMRQLDDIAASIDSSVGKFHRGHDLNSLFSFGPDIWALCDHAACLDDTKYPNLRFFVDMAQLDEKVLQMYQQYVESTTPPSSSIAASPSAVSTSSTSLTDSKSAAMPSPPPPPPPASPPSIPPPSCHTDTSDSSFKVVSWNILSSDYCHPSTFFYCSPDDLSWSHRSTRIRSILADESGDLELFQEVDYDSVANGEFDTVTHGSVYIRRPNHKRDGLLTRWRRSKFELLQLPQLVTLDARFAKNGTERRREKMEWRVTGVDSEPCSDQPRTYSTLAQRATSGKAQRNGASATTTTSASLDKQDTPNSTPSSDDDHRRHRNLMKRQSHILTCLEKVEARLDALTQVMRERFVQVRPDSVLPSALLATPPTPVLPSQSHSQSHPPHAHGHPHIAVMDKFHVIHFNDLSLLTRTKSNSTSSMFARYKKENIGLMLLFRHRATRRLILVVNVHLFWNPEYEDVKCAQAMFALQHIEEMKKQLALVYPSSEPVEVVFGGDFNSTPTSDVVRLMTQATAPIRVESVQPSEAAHQPKQIVSSSLHDIVFDTLPVDTATAPSVPVSIAFSPPPPFRLLLDSSLMKVTKWLRAIGIDTLCLPSSTPTSTDALDLARVIDEFFQVARRDERVIVTQNKSLLKRRGMPPRHFLLSANIKDPLDIFHSIVNEFRLRWDVERFYSICTTCNHLVRPLTRDEYLKFPFLPVEYRTGLDDDGAPLFLTECTGPSCRRVRWWSSKRQRESREKLFQVRLDMEVELTDDENENENEAETTEEERVEEVAKVSPVTDPSSPKSSSPSPSLPNSSSVPFEKPSAADILAARVARKAAKAATKSERMQAAAVRRAANAETFNFHKFAEGAKLRGDDGEYLFDRKPTDHRAGLPTEVNGTSHVISSLSTLHATSDSPSTAMLESTTNSSLLGIHSGTTTASSELWWTSEKKQRMIQVERRIIVETRKLLHQKRAKQAKAKQQQSQEPQESTKVTKNSSSRISPLTPALGSSPSSPTSLSFSHALTQYWHSVVDHFVTPAGKNSHHVATDMRFQSVYPYQTQQQVEGRTDTGNAPLLDDPLDVPVTNCTPKFIDMIDYIFYTGASDLFQLSNSRRLCTRREFATLDLIGYPSSDWPSDHQLLAATFRMAQSE